MLLVVYYYLIIDVIWVWELCEVCEFINLKNKISLIMNL